MKEECLLLAERNLPEECPETFSIERLTGDASTRSYFRIGVPRGEKLVLMKMPEPFAEEKFPYLDNYRLFGSLGVRLAEIYHMNPQRGYVFLQDLGDLTFYELYPGWDRKTTLSFICGRSNYCDRSKGANRPARLPLIHKNFCGS